MDIGERLKYYRTCKEFSIYRLHLETGISQNHISGIESNKRQPTIDTLSRLLSPLGITLSEFFNESDASFLSEDEKELVANFRTIPKEKSDILLELSRALK